MSKEHEGALPIPPSVSHDFHAVELARIWASGGIQHVTLASEAWDDPAAWGIMLVDLAKHLAVAYNERRGDDPASVLARIKEGFDAEWQSPID